MITDEQRREAEDQTDATERARTLAEAPGIPLGQSPARRAADDARAAADRAKANLAASRLAVGQAEQLAAQAERNAVAAEAAAQAAERVAATAKKAVKAARRAADVARCRAARARAHVGSLVRAHAIEAAEVRAQEAGAEARTQATALQAAEDAADRAEEAANMAEARRWFTAVQASKTARAAEHAEIDAALDEITADRAERRARRLEQIAQDTLNKAVLSARRARADGLLDGPLPAGRPTPLTGRWSPARPPPSDDDDSNDDDEPPITNPWTLTDYVSWLRSVGPSSLRIVGRVGIDGEIAAFTIEPSAPSAGSSKWPTSGAWVIDLSGVSLTEDPAARLRAVRARLYRNRRLPSSRKFGLPRDLESWADSTWTALPTGRPLTDDEIEIVLLRYVLAAERRAVAAPRSLCSGGLAVADGATWRAAGAAQGLLEGPTP